MSDWEDRLEQYDNDDEAEALREISNDSPDIDEDTNLIEYIFGDEETGEEFFQWLREKQKGTHILDLNKIQKANRLKVLVKMAFEENTNVFIKDPNVKINFIAVTAAGKRLVITNPRLFWYVATKASDGAEVVEKLNDTVEIDFGIKDVALKIGD